MNVNVYPWVHFVKDGSEGGILYDILHKRIVYLSDDDTDLLKKGANEDNINNKLINYLVTNDFIHLEENQYYVDKLRIGGELDDTPVFSNNMDIKHLEIILPQICESLDVCPLYNDDVTLSFTCETCYGNCEYQNKTINKLEYIDELKNILNRYDVNGIQLSLNSREVFNDIENIIFNTDVKYAIINVPDRMLLNEQVLNYIKYIVKKCSYKTQMAININIFNKPMLEHNKIISELARINDLITLYVYMVDLNNYDEQNIREKGLPINKNTLIVPYYKSNQNYKHYNDAYKNIIKEAMELFKFPDINDFTNHYFKNNRPCLISHMLIDPELNISNCKAYWLNDVRYQYDRQGLINILNNRKFNVDMCTSCSLRPGCYMCKDFAQKINAEKLICPLKFNKFGEIMI